MLDCIIDGRKEKAINHQIILNVFCKSFLVSECTFCDKSITLLQSFSDLFHSFDKILNSFNKIFANRNDDFLLENRQMEKSL